MSQYAVTCRSLGADETDLLVQCIRSVYGDSYPLPEFYDAGFIRERIEQGLLHSEIAVNEAGEAVGNLCTQLEQLGDYTGDSTALIVNEAYRGQRVLGQLGVRIADVYGRLRLQRFSADVMNVDGLKIAFAEGRALLDFVLADMHSVPSV